MSYFNVHCFKSHLLKGLFAMCVHQWHATKKRIIYVQCCLKIQPKKFPSCLFCSLNVNISCGRFAPAGIHFSFVLEENKNVYTRSVEDST